MDAYAYPGKGLSLSQLAFALGEELKRAAHSPSFTFDDVSRLDQDISTTLTTIREWRNSFLRINRVPLDILSLIPTHLPSQKDRFHVSFVCRHWRRTFLRHAALWSQLYLSNGELYVKTLLERAKGSALDVITKRTDPVGAVTLLPPHTTQIRSLYFKRDYWTKIQMFSEIDSGPLPLLRVLRINVVEEFNLDGTDAMTPPTLPLFSNAVNLREFSLHSEGSPFIDCFVFPNLTRFELVAAPAEVGFPTSLLDFLEASPTLRTVEMNIFGDMSQQNIPQGRAIVLPNVEAFALAAHNGGSAYELAAHISCPSAKHTLLTHERDADDITTGEIFPNPISWSAITRQYTRGPVEEVVLQIKADSDVFLSCSLTFQSPDATVLRLDYEIPASDEDDLDIGMPLADLHCEIFYQASRVIRDHPLLASVKRIHIDHRHFVPGSSEFARISEEVGRLFKSVGPLEKLTINNSDLYLYLGPFADNQGPRSAPRPFIFPPIKELTISHPLLLRDNEKRMAAIVGFAKSHHALGTPFERVTVYMEDLPTALAERLEPWVGTVDCREEKRPDVFW